MPLSLSLYEVRGKGCVHAALSRSLSSLHFASQGMSPLVTDPRPGAPFPDSAVEEALGSSKVGGCSPTCGVTGGVCPLRTQPSLYFSPLPGLIAVLTKAISLVLRQAHPQENPWYVVNPRSKHWRPNLRN